MAGATRNSEPSCDLQCWDVSRPATWAPRPPEIPSECGIGPAGARVTIDRMDEFSASSEGRGLHSPPRKFRPLQPNVPFNPVKGCNFSRGGHEVGRKHPERPRKIPQSSRNAVNSLVTSGSTPGQRRVGGGVRRVRQRLNEGSDPDDGGASPGPRRPLERTVPAPLPPLGGPPSAFAPDHAGQVACCSVLGPHPAARRCGRAR